MQWLKLRSWHGVRPDGARTLCGRLIPPSRAPLSYRTKEDLPAEKSCESCLRIFARSKDKD